MKIALTGHRPDKLGGEYDGRGPYSFYILNALNSILKPYKEKGIKIYGICGMALGADMLWAETLIENDIPWVAAVPFEGQESLWSKASQQRYFYLLSKSTSIKNICPPGFSPVKMQVRNQWMVDQLTEADDFLISVWDGSKGGTANCTKYAEKKKAKIININPKLYVNS